MSSPPNLAIYASVPTPLLLPNGSSDWRVVVMYMHAIVVRMHDRNDWESLGRIAESQGGYFTAEQARAIGFHRNTLSGQVREGGRLEKVERGLYRLRFFPRSAFDPIAAAWVQAGPETAVVSHESALELYALSDVAPREVHLTIPREQRWRRAPVGTRYHRPRRPLAPSDVRNVHGIRTTSPERTIVDVIEAGTQPEQVEHAVRDALARALTTVGLLRKAATGKAQTVRDATDRAIAVR